MKTTIGILLIIAGFIFGVYVFTKDTTVKVDYNGVDSAGLPERVNNLGLMSEKQNLLIFSGVIIICGFLLIAIGDDDSDIIILDSASKKNKPNCEPKISNVTKNKTLYCSNCGKCYISNEDVVFCEECGNKL
jgi:hypothetical protein